MKTINQNILEVKSGIIVHQVNTLGMMDAGLAKQIADKWPLVLKEYNEFSSNSPRLGDVILTRIEKDFYVCSVYAQETIGHFGVHTKYWAVQHGLQRLESFINIVPLDVYIPYLMGCGLGGGDWSIVSKIIEQEIPDAIICKWRNQ